MSTMKNIPIPVVTEGQNHRDADEATARQWLEDSAKTATALDFDAHMNLISRKVAVRGVPEVEVVDYAAWEKACRKEFADKVLEEVSYRGFSFVAGNVQRIMFKTIECIKARGEDVKEHGLEVVIEKEDDGVWRAIQERILSPEEVIHDGIDA